MVRSYLRHEPTSAFGLICSASANSILDPDSKTAFVPALEDVLVWDVRRGALLATWHEIGHRSKVTALARSPSDPDTFAVGYEDGSIRLWSAQTNSTSVTFNGHKKAVVALTFDAQGLRVASASLDTDIILWDLVAETGLYRLRGHRDAVTAIAFVQLPSTLVNPDEPSSSTAVLAESDAAGYLLSTSKDGLMKLWDLSLQHCVETVVHGSNEIWSLGVSQDVPLAMQVSTRGKQADEDDEESADRNAVADGGALVLTGSADGDMRVWEISAEALSRGLQTVSSADGPANGSSDKFITPKGSIPLSGKHRVTQIEFCGVPKRQTSTASATAAHGQGYIAVSSTDKAVQVFRLRSTEEMAKKLERRRKRNKEKAEKKRAKEGASSTAADTTADVPDQVTWADRIEAYTNVRPAAGKLKSFSLVTPRSSSAAANKFGLSVLCGLSTNALEIYSVPAPPRSKAEKANPIEPVLASALESPGHRSDIRAVALSSDDTLLASACGAGQLKIWNVNTGRCIRTLPCGYALSVAWLPGDQHVLVGCKDGTLRSFDVRAGIAVETLEAHQGPLWSVAVQPDGLGCVSASADKEVKFWEFEMQVPEDDSDDEDTPSNADANGSKAQAPPQLALVHVRTLKMTDDVLCARFSPNGKLLALSLLDNTVKVFFADTLKFFLSLYGHKLPVLALDISGDSKLCVTVSADKNVKLWGLDFGDCHKSIFAHNESIMGVCFERGQQGGGLMGGRQGNSHHFWTVGKDGLVKHWDGDNFQMIQQLEGHHGEVWAVAPGHAGKMVVTAGADRSIRTWEKTDEPLFLEEEREREMERAFENAGQTRQDEELAIGSLADGADPDAQGASSGPEATAVSKTTSETMMAGERLIEALETGDADIAARTAARANGEAEPAYHALITAEFDSGSRHRSPVDEDISAQKYVLRVVEKILPAQLDDALLVLPFDKVLSLLRYLDYWARKEWNIPLVSRVLFFLLRTHHSQIVANRVMRPTLLDLKSHLRQALARQKATIGFNLAALKFIKAQHVAQKTSEVYEREGLDVDEDKVRQKVEANAARKRKLRVA
ncbi:Small-subunit processome, Utp12 [Kalmanozyma brasiliensis GHG001]|uniref:Small-subunit processome Utp12 domain-containing protein n=1 Tax=Kalmanozyma brasiliensis (strain GHG001) TaxID=1365824 RepID=V5GJW1_KALBG|nr:Small-subunit processome, Utp12 [Kalmanozyma brasiliensis GHG001]EST06247.1 Small-subunit processome, Utp12 [Kalmanozyma brasiliensis GHG001]